MLLTFLKKIGKSDPYVEVFQDNEKIYKTAKKRNTLNPEWNEQFSFLKKDFSGRINFKVCSKMLMEV